MRKIIITACAASALAAAVPAIASADVAVDSNGVGYVGKGDVQNALSLKNDAALQTKFLAGQINFTAGYTKTYDNVLTCADGSEHHVLVTSAGSGTADVVADTNKAGKVNGWTVKGIDRASTMAGSNDLYKVMQATFTVCLPDKPYSEMTPEELRRLPTRVVTPSEASVTFDGLAVNGAPLPNTPVVPAA